MYYSYKLYYYDGVLVGETTPFFRKGWFHQVNERKTRKYAI